MSSSISTPPTGIHADVETLLDQINRLAQRALTEATITELAPLLIRLEQAQNQLAGISSRWLASFDQAGGPDEHGAPSINVWARRELRVTPAETARRRKRAAALDALPDTAGALAEGTIGLSHLDQIAHGVHQLGPEVITAVEPILLEVAATCDANAVRVAVQKTRDTLDPDASVAAYIRSM